MRVAYNNKQIMRYPSCYCEDLILSHVPIHYLVSLIRGYVICFDADLLNSLIDMYGSYQFNNPDFLRIKYVKDQLLFMRSVYNSTSYSRITMYCNIHNVPYLLQDNEQMDVVCAWARDQQLLKTHLFKLGAYLVRFLNTCHINE